MYGQENIKQDSFSSALQIPFKFQRDCEQNVQEKKIMYLYAYIRGVEPCCVLEGTFQVKSD